MSAKSSKIALFGKKTHLYGMLLKPSYTIKEALNQQQQKTNYGIYKNSQNENFCFIFYG